MTIKLNKKTIKRLIYFGLGLALLILILVPSYFFALRINQYLPPKTRDFLTKTHHQTKIQLANLTDIFYLKTFFHSNLTKDLKTLNLILSVNDLNSIFTDIDKATSLGYHDKTAANQQQITLNYQNQEIPAELSFHAGGTKLIAALKPDYNLKLLANQQINQNFSFNLFNPAIHDWITPLLANHVASKLDLYLTHQEPIRLEINQRHQGIYTLEEKTNQAFLDRLGLSTATIIKLKDETRLLHRNNPVGLNAHHLSGFDFEIANVDSTDDPQVLYQLDQFFKAIKSSDLNQITPFLDLGYLARYNAYRELLAIDHDTAGDNLIFLFNPQTQKFYPIVRSEGDLNQLYFQGGTTLKSFNQYNPHLEEQYDYPRLFLLLHQNSQFRQLKYQYLNQLVEDYDQLAVEFQDIYQNLGQAYLYDTTDEVSTKHKKKLFQSYLNKINHNQKLIKTQLEFAQIAVNVINQGRTVTIEIIPDAVIPVEFTQFKLELASGLSQDITNIINQKLIMASYSQDYDLLSTTFSYSIPVISPVTSINVKAQNQITKQEITSIHSAIATQ